MNLTAEVRSAMQMALTLAATPSIALEEIQIGRYRLAGATSDWSADVHLLRRYVLGAPGPDGITQAEARNLLDVGDASTGDTIEVVHRYVGLKDILVGLAHPDRAVLKRVAAATQVSETNLRRAVTTVEIDLERHEAAGQRWGEHNPKWNMYRPYKVVAEVHDESREISQADARCLRASAAVGESLSFSSSVPRPLADLFPSPTHECALEAPDFETLRAIFNPVETPDTLLPFQLGPLRLLFPEFHDVLFADVKRIDAERIWRQLDAEAARTGFRPVLLGGDPTSVREVQLAWGRARAASEEHLQMVEECRALGHEFRDLQSQTHPTTEPFSVLKFAQEVNPNALLTRGGNPSYSNIEPEPGEWPAAIEQGSLRCFDDAHETARLALVPTDAAWKAVAWMPHVMESGEATPSLAQLVAIARHWEARFGARVVAITPATVEWIVDRELPKEIAIRAAEEHFYFCPDGGSSVLEERAAELMSGYWYAWWD